MLLALIARPAVACLVAVGPDYQAIPDETDRTPPSAPGRPEVGRVIRGLGPMNGSCADLGVMTVTLDAAVDDLSDVRSIGYVLRVVEGNPPDGASFDEPVRRAATVSEDGVASLPLVWIDGATAVQDPFDFTLGIVPLDEAGNEGPEVTITIADPGRPPLGRCAGSPVLLLSGLATCASRRRSAEKARSRQCGQS